MLLCAQYVIPVTSEPIKGGAILIRDGLIRDVGSAEMLKLRYPDEEIKDFGLAALMPGFVDLYTHMEDAVMRGVVHDVPYATWATSVAEKSMKLDVADWYDSAILGGLEALSSGVTTVADVTSTGASCTAVQKLGMRGVIYRQVTAMDKRRVGYAMRAAENDIMHWSGEVDSDRVTIGVAAAPLYACHPEVLQRVSELAQSKDLPVALFLAGSREEYNFIKYGSSPFSVHAMAEKRGFVEVPPWLPTGVSPVRYALNWGAFDSDRVLAIYCVHVDDEDIQKLKEYNVNVAVCPRSNAQLGMGVAPVDKIMRAGIPLGLGTDSPAATESTDMIGEMRIGMLMQRAVNVGHFLDSSTVLELATIGGAKALGMDDRIGSLDVGKCADVVAVDLSSSHQSPSADPVSAVVNSCSNSDVLMTMVDGNVLYEKDHWHVGVEVAKNIAHVIDIRSKLRM